MLLRDSEVTLDDLLDRIDIPPQLVEPLIAMLRQQSILEESIDDRHLLAQLDDANIQSWFNVKGSRTLAKSVRCARPGQPLADALFNLDKIQS